MGYSVRGVAAAAVAAELLNVLTNLQISRLAMVLTTAAGAHPPGLTTAYKKNKNHSINSQQKPHH